jgi:hypothetical protein
VPHSHPSVRALLEAEGGDDPFAAIRRRARGVVAEALALGWEGPPFDMTELASLRGLEVSLSAGLADDQDACVVPGRVLVNARKHPVRRRYSVAHEVGHTLFPDYEEELRRVGRLWRRDGDESEFERLCQAAGAEFLMPLDSFIAGIEAVGPGLDGVLQLAGRFDASVEAAVRRRVETMESAAAALFLRPRDATTGAWLQVDSRDGHTPLTPLGVSLVCANSYASCFRAAQGVTPPKGGAADRAWKRVALAHGSVVIERRPAESWEHAGIAGHWSCEALTLPRAAAVPHEVLCMLHRAAG